jgi:hypothetical protein
MHQRLNEVEGFLMDIYKMKTVDGYQLNITDDLYIYFDEVTDWGSNILFKRMGVPTGGMWPPASDEFLIQWEAIQNELS